MARISIISLVDAANASEANVTFTQPANDVVKAMVVSFTLTKLVEVVAWLASETTYFVLVVLQSPGQSLRRSVQ